MKEDEGGESEYIRADRGPRGGAVIPQHAARWPLLINATAKERAEELQTLNQKAEGTPGTQGHRLGLQHWLF